MLIFTSLFNTALKILARATRQQKKIMVIYTGKEEVKVPLLSLYPKEMKSSYHKDTCTSIFIEALFIIVKI
jgi:hypothetical protein